MVTKMLRTKMDAQNSYATRAGACVRYLTNSEYFLLAVKQNFFQLHLCSSKKVESRNPIAG